MVIASTSPRRRELLARIGVTPTRIAAPDIDETPLKGELPRAYVARLAEAKARAGERTGKEVVLAGDENGEGGKSGEEGKRGGVRVDPGGGRIIRNKKVKYKWEQQTK